MFFRSMGPQRQFNIAMEIGPLIDDLAIVRWFQSPDYISLYGIIYGIKTTNQIICVFQSPVGTLW